MVATPLASLIVPIATVQAAALVSSASLSMQVSRERGWQRSVGEKDLFGRHRLMIVFAPIIL